MAYTANIRDHVWFILADATAGGFTTSFTQGADPTERFRTIRWIPAAGTDTITIERLDAGGIPFTPTAQVIWESVAGGSTSPQESRLDVRFTKGFKVVMTTGGKLYLYEALDGPIGSK